MKSVLLFIVFNSLTLACQIELNSKYYGFTSDYIKGISKYNYLNNAEKLSFIGNYKESLREWDKTNKLNSKFEKKDSLYFSMFKPVSALEYISKISDTTKIIMLNEAHHIAMHRAFSTKLLTLLYSKGYKYFAVETLNAKDSALNKRKYPIVSSGYYTNEPTYGTLIRSALEIGYELIAYETNLNEIDSNGINLREIDQAKNIKKILDKDQSAKILIYCGYSHILECTVPGWGKALAGRILELSGINPFTIDQIQLTEHSSEKYENPYYKLIHLNYYAFLVDTNGKYFKGSKSNTGYDVSVYHPRTILVNGRPNWVFENGKKAIPVLDSVKIDFPCLIFAFKKNELAECMNTNRTSLDIPVPLDVIELNSIKDEKYLALSEGSYTIYLTNKKGAWQSFEIENH